MLNLIVSVEDVATQLQLAAADVAIEQRFPAVPTSQQAEAVPALTDQLAARSLAARGDVALPGELAAGLPPEDHGSFLSQVKADVGDLWKEFDDWWQRVFSQSDQRLRAVAEKALDAAGKLGVSVEHLLARLQRRVTAGLVKSSVLPPFQVGSGSSGLTFSPSGLTVTTSVKSAPSLGSVGLDGVVKLLSDMLSLELDVAVTYAKAEAAQPGTPQ